MINVLPSIPQVTNLGVHQHETKPCFQIKPKGSLILRKLQNQNHMLVINLKN
jgi:hypothetical protein